MNERTSPHRVSAGTRIRERRLSLGRAQADLARDVGISPAYLNLIEHDRRNLTDAMRARLAAALQISEEELEGGRAQAILEGLRIAAAGEAATDAAAEEDRIAEFAARLPGWARLVVALSQMNEAQGRRLTELSDRMTQNPYLLDTLHEVLSATTSLRSTASILVQEPEMDREWRARFHGNLDQDSRRLSTTAQALVAYLDGFEDDAGLLTPHEEFEAWLAEGAPQDLPASDAARDLAQDWQDRERRDLADLPTEVLAAATGTDPSPDPLQLAQDLGLPADLVLRRLGMTEPDSGLLICDGAGGLIFRRAARGMSFGRPGDSCAMLPIFEAIGQPGTAVSRLIELETGQRLNAIALATRQSAGGLSGPFLSHSVMLMRPAPADAPVAPGQPVPVGPSCRICPRNSCPARRVSSILHTAGATGRRSSGATRL
ncbi:helix-turn-helix domain-containing protein [Paracoccus aurantiacus]|uniref:Helix-turn-helix domain-containing protein n=1 Tax=Paracoccus aurantiacus TaxID=2599412 RepID=A0A5C6S4E4_9RHOB|nr:short-chain fatty acyl-CoA regulator family protein [Paracoccus aurantiacus]TXB69315.1 helix-turn-helix domain-containing protein [Paracoccus aurantiacus]